MIALVFFALIVVVLISALGHMSSSARRQRAMLDELRRPRLEADAAARKAAEEEARKDWYIKQLEEAEEKAAQAKREQQYADRLDKLNSN